MRNALREMEKLGFDLLPSLANFVLAKHDKISGEEFYGALRERNILVRHLKNERIKNHVRITIGKKEEMNALILATKEILKQGGP